MNKNTKQNKNFKTNIKSGSNKKKEKYNKIADLYIPRQIIKKAKRPEGCSNKKKNLQPFFKVQDTLVELT